MEDTKNFKGKNLNLIIAIGIIASVIIVLSMSGCVGPQTPGNETINKTIEKPPVQEPVNETPKEAPPETSLDAVKSGNTVEVNYVGKFENGTIFDQSKPGSPMKFKVGAKQMIPGFDEAVVGMKTGETKSVTISPEKAYGMPKNVSRIQKIPVQQFVQTLKQQPVVGMEVNAPWPIKVTEVDNTTVTFENNPALDTTYGSQLKVFKLEKDYMLVGHPLAGKTLNFEITLVKIMDECESMGIAKSDKPTVSVFVMSYCPYGTQIEKGIIPVQQLLGSKADININFVHYAMHGQKEVDENTVQYCIEKEQNDKFWQYLACFLEKGDSAGCLDKAGIDKTQLQACINESDKTYNISFYLNNQSTWLSGRFPVYKVHESLAKKYGIQGSPGLVINEKMVQSSRDSESLKKAICCAFNKKPEECGRTLSNAAPAPGFGFTETGSGAAASCGG